MVRKTKQKTDTIKYQEEIEQKNKDDNFNTENSSERDLLRKLRELNNMNLEDNAKSFWIRMDQAKLDVENAKYFVSLRLQKIRELNNEIQRNKEQLLTEIWKHREGYPHIPMNKEELECELQKLKLGIEKELSGIRSNIVQLIPFIAVIGMDREQVMTKQQFENYFLSVNEKVKELTGKKL